MGQANARRHLVLVPGFVGFDALGQLSYYAGVTQAFTAFRRAREQDLAALHYFDNFPTASVAMRAERLRKFIAKKLVRGEIAHDEPLVLIGHSTGGLDIRRMLADLASGAPTYVDSASCVEASQILGHCQRLVYLSVPHFGTTLADSWCAFGPTIQAAVKTGGLGIQLNRDALAELRTKLSRLLSDTPSDLLWAIEDALNESDERARDPRTRAAEREARAELALWLEHMGKDFQIIADLRACPSDPARSQSPAHFDALTRSEELARLRSLGIATRSYATIVPGEVQRDGLVEGILSAVRHGAGTLNALFRVLNWLAEQWALQPVALSSVLARGALSSVPLPPALLAIHQRPALLFEVFHAMCSDPELAFPRPNGLVPRIKPLFGGADLPSSELDVRANDGVVNTLSMLWPYDEAARDQHSFRLVEADHGDIIGHYVRRTTQDPSSLGRRHDAYDFFPSGSGFNDVRFSAVWQDVFDFATRSTIQRAEEKSSMTKRSLILAGGGVKVAFQAGVLQVWLDEAGLSFDHADGASGGVFNLAMWCQGMSGTQIADAWRRTQPLRGVSLNLSQFPRLLWARSLFTLDAYRKNVFPSWGLDWEKIRASPKEATFNVYNFSRHELEVLPPAQLNEDWLCACVSLPMWFEPVVMNGETYIDPVYITDANLEEAIRRGADELWVIWTVSERGEWNDGFVANYFQIIETAANGHFKHFCQRIQRNNAAFAGGQRGEFGRPIALKILRAEVPIHYLVNFSQDRLVECVNLGVERARSWCKEQGIALRGGGEPLPIEVHTVETKLQFSEEMKGFISLGEADYDTGFKQGKAQKSSCSFNLTIKMNGVNRFVTHPQHEADADGYIECAAFGGRRPVSEGRFNLLVSDEDPKHRSMLYRLWFDDGAGRPLTLLGFKDVKDDPGFDVWSDTTTLYTRILEGHVMAEEDGGEKVLAAGILKLHFEDFLKELTTFRVEGPTLADRSAALARFGTLFMGKLWDVYATQVLSSGPV